MRLVVTDSQRCGLSVSAIDKRGNAAQVENVRWDVSDPALVTVEADPADPLKATVTAVGPVGSAQVNVTGDAQLGDGETPIAATLDVDVIAGAAVGFTVNTGTPEEQARVRIMASACCACSADVRGLATYTLQRGRESPLRMDTAKGTDQMTTALRKGPVSPSAFAEGTGLSRYQVNLLVQRGIVIAEGKTSGRTLRLPDASPKEAP